MKKLPALFLALLLFAHPAAAESTLYPITELPAVTMPRWQQTYTAHGRTIAVDVPVSIPAVAAAPVLTVCAANPIAEPQYTKLKSWCAQALKNDPVNRYSFRSTAFSTVLTHATPPAWGDTRESEFVQGAMGQTAADIDQPNLTAAYAENNPLPLGEAIRIAQTHAVALFPGENPALRNATVYSRTFRTRNRAPINAAGHYDLLLGQVFHGMPFLASVHQAFSLMSVGSEDPWLQFRGVMNAGVYSADAWSIACCFYREAAVRHADIPLLPFDAVLPRVEALICSGHVRRVTSAGLGYVQFDTDVPEEQRLIPAWVVWCEYHKDGPQSERADAANGTGLLYDSTDYYRPLILNGQTGELLNPESESLGRCLEPAIITK